MLKKIAVIGAGQMGGGIAQIFAAAGYEVIMKDVTAELCNKGLGSIAKSLNKLAEKGKIAAADADAILKRISITVEPGHISSCDFAIEAATENIDLKLKIFAELDKTLPKNAVLATNTSSISITKIAAATSRPDKIIGMHFMNPVPVMKGVEIIRGLATSDETAKTTEDLAVKLGKTIVRSNDFPGFIANRILMPMINEAAYALTEGVATREDIDECMKSCCNFPMGPLALADLIGLDTVQAILSVLHTGLGNPKYSPCPLIKKYVDAGWLGRKTGKGFYIY